MRGMEPNHSKSLFRPGKLFRPAHTETRKPTSRLKQGSNRLQPSSPPSLPPFYISILCNQKNKAHFFFRTHSRSYVRF